METKGQNTVQRIIGASVVLAVIAILAMGLLNSTRPVQAQGGKDVTVTRVNIQNGRGMISVQTNGSLIVGCSCTQTECFVAATN
jgi:hypothetical protein